MGMLGSPVGGVGGHLSWLKDDEYRHQQVVRGAGIRKHQKVLEAQGLERCHFHPAVALTTPYNQEAPPWFYPINSY